MMQKICLVFIALGMLSCASESNKLKEEVRFLLDKRQYTQAIAKAREAVADDAGDEEAQFLLASGLIGDSVLSGNTSCPEGDDGLLGLIACLSDPLGADETQLESFLRIAPNFSKIESLEEATDILLVLDSVNLSPSDKDNVFIRLYAARLFEIAGALTRAGLKSTNDVCNACINSDPGCVVGMKDSLPDAFNSEGLSETQKDRFRSNLQQINDEAAVLGFKQDFSLILRVEEILTEIGVDAIPTFLETTFNGNNESVCDQAL